MRFFQLEYLRDVTSLAVHPDRCNGCRTCLAVCPHDVLLLVDKRVQIQAADRCMECGACAKNCAREAIAVRAGVGCAAAIIAGKVPPDSVDGTAPDAADSAAACAAADG